MKWNVGPTPNGAIEIHDNLTGKRLAQCCKAGDAENPEVIKRAKLMAAAPEMFEFIQKELTWLIHIEKSMNDTPVRHGVRNAIKSAQTVISFAE